MIYLFEDFSLDSERRELRRESQLVGVEPQVFDILLYLVVLILVAIVLFGIALLRAFFTVGGGFDFVMLRDLLPHPLVNGMFASPVSRIVEAVATAFSDDDSVRRALWLAPRGRSA